MKLVTVYISCYCIIPCFVMFSLQFEEETGVLHSSLDFLKWHTTEERILHLLKRELEALKTEFKLVKKILYPNYKLKLFGLTKKIFKENGDLIALLSGAEHLWVGSVDLVFSMMGFSLIQQFNLLNPQTISNGFKVDTHFGSNLKERDFMEIGIFALFKDLYDLSVEWLEFGRRKAEKQDDLIDLLISLAIQKHNRIGYHIHKLRSLDISQEKAINLYTRDISLNQPANQRISTRKVEFEKFKSLGSNINSTIYVKMVNLCIWNSGHPHFTPFQSNLKCYFEAKKHPYFYINPVKTEELAKFPPIYQFYDVLSSKMIQMLKMRFLSLVKPETNLAGALQEKTCGNHARTRLFYDEGPKELFQLSERLSGLNIMKMSGQNFFAEYTYGRMYSVHMDHSINSSEFGFRDEIQRIEDRYATMVYYLEIPEAGGRTAFLDAGLFPYPVKASAIFWYNMYRNGSLRYDVTHLSCPVLHGNKITVNHFFWHNNNWNKSKCTLNQLE